MSATTTGPAGAAPGTTTPAADAGSGGQGGVGSGANGDAGASPSGADYEGRVRAGGDWSVAEVKNQQRRADQATEELRQLKSWVGTLSVYQQQGLTGDVLAQHLDGYLDILAKPQGQQMIRKLQSGQVDSQPAPDDTYLTDEEKEIRSLKENVSRLEGRLAGQDASIGQQALLRHVGKVASEWNLSDTDRGAVADYLTQQVQTWSRQGETGLTAIRNLSSPEGWKTVEMLAIQKLGRERLSENLKAQLLRDQKTRSGLSTDSPSGIVPQSAAPPPVIQSTLEALRYAREHPEALESYGE